MPIVPQPTGPATAVVVTGGKQYRVSPGQRVVVGRLAAEPGAEVTLDKVLMHADGDSFQVGNPTIEGLGVTVKVVGHSRGPKVLAFRYKSKKNVRVRKGTRADLTTIEVTAIGDAKPAAKRGRATKAEAAEGDE